MSTRLIHILTFLLMLNLACDEKKPITQELCERQTNRADCEAAGCTYTCGMVLKKEAKPYGPKDCVARRNVGRCLAVVKLNREPGMEIEYDYGIDANSTGWKMDEFSQIINENNTTFEYRSYFKLRNKLPYAVEVLGYPHPTWPVAFEEEDPCTLYDPDETLFPWEGSCETDWWSEAMWDDVLPE